ncbi:PTS sugar transporter subunit IIA [Sphingomonas sp.]|uniref:PTS sugar transporter subunit IIA n=1 Tax=Sphingomonas sp. TaxID=28214 RepID=UPI003B00F58B
MDDFSDILAADAVFHDLAAGSKKALFAQVGGLAARGLALDPKLIAERLAERERLGSTGFGAGVAIPHGKIDGLPRVVGLFAMLDRPLDFAAIDAVPVDLVFVLLSPPDAGVDHLKALARVSRRLRDRAFVAKLRGAGSADALYALFADGGARDAA